MSFKRAGDDHCALRLQKKQRVAELFAEDIPADEVEKTRSGKYICLVCPQNPVLDTMPMLSIHRQGKKHLTNVSIKIEKDHNLNELIQKQKQELYLREASINDKPLNTRTNALESFNSDVSEAAPLLAKTRQLAESVTSKSTNKSQNQKFENKSVLFREGGTMRSERFPNEQPRDLFKKNKPFFQSRVELKLSKDIFFDKKVKNPLSSDTEHRLNTTKQKSGLKTSPRDLQGSQSVSTPAAIHKDNGDVKSRLMPMTSNSCKQDLTNCSEVNVAANRIIDRQLVKNCSDDSQQTRVNYSGSKKMNREQQKKYLEMKMSGWILDSNGKWIKDENVEFDSDEDEPSQ